MPHALAAAVVLSLVVAACSVSPERSPAAADDLADAGPGFVMDAASRPSDEPDAAPIAEPNGARSAIDFGLSLVGTPYGWWYSGPLPEGEPMWTADGPPPPAEVVLAQSANCAGLTNLMLRHIGVPLPTSELGGTGGTYSYEEYYADVAEPFDVSRAYPAGTLIGRGYRDTYDQGHLAVVLASGKVLQSFAFERDGTTPGVNTTYTVAESDDGGFYEYAVLPEDWLGERPVCAWGDGLYCGQVGVDGDPNALYQCKDDQTELIETCAQSCLPAEDGKPARCAAP